MISVLKCRASRMAREVFPAAVGPETTNRFLLILLMNAFLRVGKLTGVNAGTTKNLRSRPDFLQRLRLRCCSPLLLLPYQTLRRYERDRIFLPRLRSVHPAGFWCRTGSALYL